MSNLVGLPPKQGELAISASSGATYRECPRKYELAFLHQLTADGFNAPFFVGDMVHLGLEKFYKREHPKIIVEDVQNALIAKMQGTFIPAEDMDGADKDVSIVIGMLIGYFKHYGPNELALWNPIHGSEFGFRLKFSAHGVEIPFVGKIDMIATNSKDGQLWMVEHKTTGLSTNEYLTKWHMGMQPHGYVWAGRRLHAAGILPTRPSGCMINVIKKPGIRLKKTETQDQFNLRLTQEYLDNPDKYFAREWIPIGDREIAWFEQQLAEWIRRMQHDARIGFFPQNTDACHSHFGACRMFPICFQGERDPGVFQYYRLRESQFEEVGEYDYNEYT